jgi:uncharacterized protein YqjF (DUF2071 family)
MPNAAARPFLTARWLHLAMLNYEVDPALLAKRVPAGTELDLWQGRCLASLVGFRFEDTRVRGLAIPFHRDFVEVNLRFYVRRPHRDGDRRGVVFVKELVPRRAIAWLARRLYHENYQALPMSHRDEIGRSEEPYVGYAWRFGGRDHALGVRVAGAPALPDADSEEAFVSEHYWGYVRQRDGSTLEYRVEHPRWPVWRAGAAELRGDVSGLYGPELAECLAGAPSSAFLAEGSPVVVHRGVPLARGAA